jgi:O-antigen biosynthesis protein
MINNRYPSCSIVIVNYNGLKYMNKCLDTLQEIHYPKDKVEIIVVDNGSTDRSLQSVREKYSKVKIFENDKNSFTRALNLAIDKSKSEFIAFLNNDVEVDKNWLIEMVHTLEEHPEAGCVGGKILFDDRKTINSVGHSQLPDYYFRDKGFEEIDAGQYNQVCEADGICGGSILYRRSCLDEIGWFDEDYIMYFEDVDMAYRCKEKNYKILYTPKSIVYHHFHGTSGGTNLSYLLCNRNRLFFLARHLPSELPKSIKTSHLYLNNQFEFLLLCMPATINKLIQYNSVEVVEKVLPELFDELMAFAKPVDLLKVLSQYHIQYGKKKPSLGIYDHALHLIGGGQKYSATIAQILQGQFDVTFISNKDVNMNDLERWYGLDLHNVRLNVVPLDYFEGLNRREIDPNLVDALEFNPFEKIAAESAKYDILLIANMVSKVKPLSPYSIFICHFPDSERNKYFYVDDYSYLVCNSEYGKYWIKKRWNLDADKVLYPSVDMFPGDSTLPKENIILSVTRFEVGGSKKQLEMIEAFLQLCKQYPAIRKLWKFVLVGGSIQVNPYLERVRKVIEESGETNIEVYANASLDIVRKYYRRAKIFWHACGLHESNPHLVEHFGMTTVEAMQNSCVPIVINGGGQKEIVEHAKSGYLFDELPELVSYTYQLISNEQRLHQLSKQAFERSKLFSAERFANSTKEIFNRAVEKYFTPTVQSVADLAKYIVKNSPVE